MNSHHSRTLHRALVVSVGIHLAAIAISFAFEVVHPPTATANSVRYTLAAEIFAPAPIVLPAVGRRQGVAEPEGSPPPPMRTAVPMAPVEDLTAPEATPIPQELINLVAAERPSLQVSMPVSSVFSESALVANFQLPPPAMVAGGKLQLAEVVHRTTPVYPQLARLARVEGMVLVRATVNHEGAIDKAEVLEGHPFLIEAALDCVRQWRYRPALLNGHPIESEIKVRVQFVLTFSGNEHR